MIAIAIIKWSKSFFQIMEGNILHDGQLPYTNKLTQLLGVIWKKVTKREERNKNVNWNDSTADRDSIPKKENTGMLQVLIGFKVYLSWKRCRYACDVLEITLIDIRTNSSHHRLSQENIKRTKCREKIAMYIGN